MSNFKGGKVILRQDGSYVINYGGDPGYPFHVPVDSLETENLYHTIFDYVVANPDQCVEESNPSQVAIVVIPAIVHFSKLVDARLDEFAQSKHYSSISNAMLMQLSGSYQQDGKDAQRAYDQTWDKAIELIPFVVDEKITMEDAISQLPELSWSE